MDGNDNSGNYNSGYRNSGNYNSGNDNSGNDNSGYYNSGNDNSGYYNSGNDNSGYRNSGNRNSGYRNSGNYNSGDYNSGNCNSGNCNSGYYNSGDYNSGYFCENTPAVTFFDSPSNVKFTDVDIPFVPLEVTCQWIPESDMSDEQKKSYPSHATLGGFLLSQPKPLTEAFPKGWAMLSDEDKQKFLDLPNFDPDKFFRITGVDVRDGQSPVSVASDFKTIEIDGVKYNLIPVRD